MTRRLLVLGLFLAAGIAQAAPPKSSLRPVLRPWSSPDVALTLIQQVIPQMLALQAEDVGVERSLRPKLRPKSGMRVKTPRRQAQKGAVCNDPALQGDVLGRVPGKLRGCGLTNAVRLRSVSGIKLSTPATMDCKTAKALKKWVDTGLKPTIGRYGGGPSSIRVFASYSCRTRNNKPGAKISEHGRGKAIDIGAITLKNGKQISVLGNWSDRKKGKMLRKLHKSACGPFGTVLGPESDRFHRDHFHFDTASYRSGPYCR